jgi:hypothetical protein
MTKPVSSFLQKKKNSRTPMMMETVSNLLQKKNSHTTLMTKTVSNLQKKKNYPTLSSATADFVAAKIWFDS